MSKKHRKQEGSSISQTGGAALSHQAEYRIIKFDLIKVVILNAVYLVLILALYFANQKTHLVDNWFARLLHF